MIYLPSTRRFIPGLLPAFRRPQTAAGGGASAFTFIQDTSATNNGGSISSLTFSSPLTANSLIWVFEKWEGSGNPTGITESGGGTFTVGTEPTPQEGGDLNCNSFWLLAANGGGTVLNVSNTGTLSFSRSVAVEFSYGGTCTHVVSGHASASSGNPASQSVTNSGTHRLNLVGVGNYTGNAFDSPTIGGVSATTKPGTQLSDSWTFYNNEELSSETGNINYGTFASWVLSMNCFAAN